MYTFSSKLKTFSFILMVLGILGIGYGFLTAPKNIQEVEQILAAQSHEHGHEGVSEHHIKDDMELDDPAKYVSKGEVNSTETTVNEKGHPLDNKVTASD